MTEAVENVVIVGSGPAGYTAAIYAARAILRPLLITGFQDGGIPGGQLMTTTHVENFPGFPDGILGPDLMDRCKAQALRWGTRLVEADAEAIDLSQRPYRIRAEGQTIQAQSLILATGASANRLHLPSEERFWSRGISACAICDGATPQFRSEQLAVVGGGDSACEEAVYLTKYGSHVHLIVRGDRLRASGAMADRVLANPAITVHWHSLVADAFGRNVDVRCPKDRVGDQAGRFGTSPVPMEMASGVTESSAAVGVLGGPSHMLGLFSGNRAANVWVSTVGSIGTVHRALGCDRREDRRDALHVLPKSHVKVPFVSGFKRFNSPGDRMLRKLVELRTPVRIDRPMGFEITTQPL